MLFNYVDWYTEDDVPERCSFSIRYSSSATPPKRIDSSVYKLCTIECDWDKPFREWRPIGNPYEGYRQHDDLALALTFDGEPKWKVRCGESQAEREVEVEYMG